MFSFQAKSEIAVYPQCALGDSASLRVKWYFLKICYLHQVLVSTALHSSSMLIFEICQRLMVHVEIILPACPEMEMKNLVKKTSKSFLIIIWSWFFCNTNISRAGIVCVMTRPIDFSASGSTTKWPLEGGRRGGGVVS